MILQDSNETKCDEIREVAMLLRETRNLKEYYIDHKGDIMFIHNAKQPNFK